MNFYQRTEYFGKERGLETKIQITDRKDSLVYSFEGKLPGEVEGCLDYLIAEMKKALSKYLDRG